MPTTLATIEMRAGELLKKHAIMGFPGDLRKLAIKEGIELEPKPSQGGVSGGIILAAETPVIFYMDSGVSAGFRNFTIGHELGHWCMPGHAETIFETGGIHHSPVGGFKSGKQKIEIEADHFSAFLQCPRGPALRLLEGIDPGIDAVITLSETSKSSLLSAAIRTTRLDPWPCAMVALEEGKVMFAFESRSFREALGGSRPRKGDSAPYGSLAAKMSCESWSGRQISIRDTDIGDWYDQSDQPLSEETISLGRFGAIVFLTGVNAIGDENEDDLEEQLIKENWAVNFKK